MKNQIISDLKRYINESTLKEKLSFSILYGGFFYNLNNPHYKGDLDIIIVTKNNPSIRDLKTAIKIILKISDTYRLPLDEEVKYKHKLIVGESRLNSIFSLDAFCEIEGISVPKITGLEYLNSKDFIDRLFLNILTSPNIFLVGNKKKYEKFTRKGFEALFNLSISLNKGKEDDIEIIIEKLFTPSGISYKNYLGYPDIKQCRIYLSKKLKEIGEKNYEV